MVCGEGVEREGDGLDDGVVDAIKGVRKREMRASGGGRVAKKGDASWCCMNGSGENKVLKSDNDNGGGSLGFGD
ncbi:hypothetical protein RIF29_35672 [Crotalaria pallida]|uniref:Uncharacterized protein n=1 Tax=Crotalaria pallida TaxID=3830 RepID=A0AAN9HTX2_CROPI